MSIVILVYNTAAYVGQAIRCALGQTFADFEVIVLDDASTDQSAAVIRQVSDPRLSTHRNERNLGFAASVNRAMGLVRGELVAFPGSDDMLEPEFLERTVNMLGAGPKLSLVHTAASWMDDTGTAFGRSKDGWRTITPGRDAFLAALRVGFCFPGVLMRTSVLRNVGPVPEWWAGLADSWVFLRLCLEGDVGYLDDQLVRYRVHDKSISLTMYHSGEYFWHHRRIIASAFDLPQARAAGVDRCKRRGLRYVASDSIRLLHLNRMGLGRMPFLRQYASIVAHAPTVLVYPHVWARLMLGLMPRSIIAGLRQWKRRRWRLRERIGHGLTRGHEDEHSGAGNDPVVPA